MQKHLVIDKNTIQKRQEKKEVEDKKNKKMLAFCFFLDSEIIFRIGFYTG